jgi:hypothetical protein
MFCKVSSLSSGDSMSNEGDVEKITQAKSSVNAAEATQEGGLRDWMTVAGV